MNVDWVKGAHSQSPSCHLPLPPHSELEFGSSKHDPSDLAQTEAEGKVCTASHSPERMGQGQILGADLGLQPCMSAQPQT
jgi:hypothetical protein